MATTTISIPIRDDVPRTLEQVADALGTPYTINTLRAAADRGELVTYRVVGTALFTDRRYVEDWIERCRARASDAGPPGQTEPPEPAPPAAGTTPDNRTAAVAAAEEVASRLTGGGRQAPKDQPRPKRRSIPAGVVMRRDSR